jgi:hypothetical protein
MIILATQEAKIRRSQFKASLGKYLGEITSKKNHKKRAGGVGQGVDPEFKPLYLQKKRKDLEVRPCMVLHSCNSSYTGDRHQSFRPA